MPRPPRQPPPPRPPSGARLLALRKAAGFTQAELAHRIGEKQTSVSLWERSNAPPRSDALPKLAKALDVSVEALLGQAAKDVLIAPLTDNPGHVGELERAFEDVRNMPRRQQKKVLDVLIAVINEYKRKTV
jgi:transcriptional regulator with XRE-family HTH domain